MRTDKHHLPKFLASDKRIYVIKRFLSAATYPTFLQAPGSRRKENDWKVL
jgi:hypothetical protein